VYYLTTLPVAKIGAVLVVRMVISGIKLTGEKSKYLAMARQFF
jgi:hypothetical protein